MTSIVRRFSLLARLLLAGLLLAGCAGAEAQPRRTAAPSPGATVARTATRVVTATIAPRASPTTIALLTARDQRTVVHVFTDAENRKITLYYGRGLGRQGDWGWAHIINKHLLGVWSEGGPITTFDVIGLSSPDQVQDLIGRALREDARPDPSSDGRREYRLPVANGYEMLVVVGSDGAIITAYPDRPRRSRS